MLGVERALAAAGLRSRMLLQVHDELVLELFPEERDVVEQLVRKEMGTAMELAVPLEVSVGGWRLVVHGGPLSRQPHRDQAVVGLNMKKTRGIPLVVRVVVIPADDDGERRVASAPFQQVRVRLEVADGDLLGLGVLVAGDTAVGRIQLQDVALLELAGATFVELVTDSATLLVGVDRQDYLAGIGGDLRSLVPPRSGLGFVLRRGCDGAILLVAQRDYVRVDAERSIE